MKAKDVKHILNITQPTLSRYVKIGLIKVVKVNKNHYIYNDEDVYALIGNKKSYKNRINVIYSRVSTQSQKSQLELQQQRVLNYCISKGIDIDKSIKQIGSGMNNNRVKFIELIHNIIQGKINIVVVQNKDRLIRFGFELLQNIFKCFGTTIIVINQNIQQKSYQQQLTQDLISIIHHFSMKMYSRRRLLNKLKKELESDND